VKGKAKHAWITPVADCREMTPNIAVPGFATQALVGPGVAVAPGGGVGVCVAPGGGVLV